MGVMGRVSSNNESSRNVIPICNTSAAYAV